MLLSDATLMLPFYPFLHLVNPPRVCWFRFFFPFDTTKNARCFIDALWCAIWWHLVLREHVTFKHATAAWASNAVLFTHMANTHTTVAPASPAIVASQLATYSNKHRLGRNASDMVGGTRSPWIKLCTFFRVIGANMTKSWWYTTYLWYANHQP